MHALRQRGSFLLSFFLPLSLSLGLFAYGASNWLLSFQRFQDRHFLSSLEQTLELAKISALIEQRPVRLCGSLDGQYCHKSPDWRKAILLFKGERLTQVIRLPQKRSLRFQAFYANQPHQLIFQKQGHTFHNGRFVYHSPYLEKEAILTINQLGRIYAQNEERSFATLRNKAPFFIETAR